MHSQNYFQATLSMIMHLLGSKVILLNKSEGTDTFNATICHQNALKMYLKLASGDALDPYLNCF